MLLLYIKPYQMLKMLNVVVYQALPNVVIYPKNAKNAKEHIFNGVKHIFNKEHTLRTDRCGWRKTERDGGGRYDGERWRTI